jgi:hypothetical protein
MRDHLIFDKKLPATILLFKSISFPFLDPLEFACHTASPQAPDLLFRLPDLQASWSSGFLVFKLPDLQASWSSSFPIFNLLGLQAFWSSSFLVFGLRASWS